MQFAKTLLALAAAVSSVAAGTVTFKTLDDKVRTVVFTPSEGHPQIESVTVSSKEDTTVTFPESYIGNFIALQQGESYQNGMLGEVTFGGWEGKTYFDVSAIVNATDKHNVKQMWPASAKTPISGCEVFPCNNAYYVFNDVQTKVTEEVDLITTLGSASD
ncbi:hypothetical protein B0T10DRAFT_292315 [Thelonectria olida]|uniref:Dnase1 protein n=1 Tax=Thelonectria olida TaxID=1576542 RepID=A0A9P8W780_9HYPO|nr:hypothetical protein B0T10DRAFT_292315 [Thelonectria olida]